MTQLKLLALSLLCAANAVAVLAAQSRIERYAALLAGATAWGQIAWLRLGILLKRRLKSYEDDDDSWEDCERLAKLALFVGASLSFYCLATNANAHPVAHNSTAIAIINGLSAVNFLCVLCGKALQEPLLILRIDRN